MSFFPRVEFPFGILVSINMGIFYPILLFFYLNFALFEFCVDFSINFQHFYAILSTKRFFNPWSLFRFSINSEKSYFPKYFNGASEQTESSKDDRLLRPGND